MPLDQVRNFVDNDILKAPFRLLGEFSIETNGAGSRVAATPLSLHSLHVTSAHSDIEPNTTFCLALGLSVPVFDLPTSSGV